MRIVDAARSTPGRVFAAIVGTTAIFLIVYGLGFANVRHALAGSAPYLAIAVVLEAGILVCSTLSLRALYGKAAGRVPASQFARAALIGYAVQGIIPAGRAAAEATRASLLARWVGAGFSGAAAARMQAVVLIANGLISIPAAIAAALAQGRTVGASWLPVAIALNAGVALALGFSLIAVVRRAHVGAWLGRHWKRARAFGAELDTALAEEPPVPVRAIAWEFVGRGVQVLQQAVLISCVGGVVGVGSALSAEGIHLVGAAVGDLIPAQLGATEGNFTLAASALGIAAASAAAIALLAHLAQLLWVSVGALVPLVWRPCPTTAPDDRSTSALPEEPT